MMQCLVILDVIFEFIMTGSLWGRRKDVGRVNLEDAIAGVESSQVGKEDWAGTQDVLPVPCWEGRKSCDMVGRQGEYWHKPRLLLVQEGKGILGWWRVARMNLVDCGKGLDEEVAGILQDRSRRMKQEIWVWSGGEEVVSMKTFYGDIMPKRMILIKKFSLYEQKKQ